MAINKKAPYFQASREALINWNGMSPEQADFTIQVSTPEQIESQTYARNSVAAAAYSLGEMFGLTPEQNTVFMQECLGDIDTHEMTDLVQERIQEQMMTRNPEQAQYFAATIAVEMADATHANWTGDNAGAFDGKKADRRQQHQFTPSAFIGTKEMMADLLFIKPVLEHVGVEVNEAEIKKAYYDKSLEDMKLYHQSFPDGYQPTMQELIIAANGIEAGYGLQLPEELSDRISNDLATSARIAEDVFAKGIAQEPEFMQQMVNAGLIRETELTDPSIVHSVDGPTGHDDFEGPVAPGEE